MSHVRQQIREQVATELTGLTTTGANVFPSRVYALQQSDLPGILIFTRSEAINEDLSDFSTYGRDLTLVIQGVAAATADLDDVLDTIAAEVEVAMQTDPTHNDVCTATLLQSTSVELNREGEKPVGEITLEYLLQYRTTPDDPETAV